MLKILEHGETGFKQHTKAQKHITYVSQIPSVTLFGWWSKSSTLGLCLSQLCCAHRSLLQSFENIRKPLYFAMIARILRDKDLIFQDEMRAKERNIEPLFAKLFYLLHICSSLSLFRFYINNMKYGNYFLPQPRLNNRPFIFILGSFCALSMRPECWTPPSQHFWHSDYEVASCFIA